MGHALHGPDLAVAEEAAQRHRTEHLVEHPCVVALLAVQVLTATETGKQQCALGLVIRDVIDPSSLGIIVVGFVALATLFAWLFWRAGLDQLEKQLVPDRLVGRNVPAMLFALLRDDKRESHQVRG